MILEREVHNSLHPHSAGLELRLARDGISGTNRKIVSCFVKAELPAPVKWHETCPWSDFFGNPDLNHCLATPRDNFGKIRITDRPPLCIRQIHLQERLPANPGEGTPPPPG